MKTADETAPPLARLLLTKVGPLLAAIATLVLAALTTAEAQTQELFILIPQNQFSASVTPEQSQRLAKLKQQPTTKNLDLVAINLGALQSDTTKFSFSGERPLTFSKQSVQNLGGADVIWQGKLPDLPGTATLVVRDGNITGTVQDGLNLFHIEPLGGGVHAIVKVDTSKLPPDHPPSAESNQQDAITPKENLHLQSAPADRGDNPVDINVIVAYTPSAEASVSDIKATIELAVAEANQSYMNSGIKIRLNLVDTVKLDYKEADTFPAIVTGFKDNPEINQRRRAAHADLAALIVNRPEACGQAAGIMVNPATAFAAVHYGCATGYYSFAHELGHLMGARHDEGNNSSQTPFPYGHGFQRPSPSANEAFRTVMAYQCKAPDKCEPRVPYWSNPNIRYKGVPTGTAADYNARVLNETAATIADFRNHLEPLVASVPQASAAADVNAVASQAKDEAPSLAGQWIIKESGEILQIDQGGIWFHPLFGRAKIRKADDSADIKVFYEHGSTRCSYRISFSENGKRLDLIAADTMQDPDYCPAGSLKKAGG